MVKVYAVVLVAGVLGLIAVIFATAFRGKDETRTRWYTELRFKALLGAMIGFGMGGMSAEFAPIGLNWPSALGLAVVAAALSVFWVRYAVALAEHP